MKRSDLEQEGTKTYTQTDSGSGKKGAELGKGAELVLVIGLHPFLSCEVGSKISDFQVFNRYTKREKMYSKVRWGEKMDRIFRKIEEKNGTKNRRKMRNIGVLRIKNVLKIHQNLHFQRIFRLLIIKMALLKIQKNRIWAYSNMGNRENRFSVRNF